MELLLKAKEIFGAEGIEYVGVLPISECKLLRPYLLKKSEISENGSAVIIAAPYYFRDEEKSNISLYAVPCDYHKYFSELFERALPLFEAAFSGHTFSGFADHSPIDERDAAAKCGLGVIGKNHMLITEKYSSFVFLGAVFTDIVTEKTASEVKHCEGCGLCIKACPVGLDASLCLSALTQKKGALTPAQEEALGANGYVWGCDKCQLACPHSASVKNTEIDFFMRDRIPFVCEKTISEMNDADFRGRAYSWRGREVILRNADILKEMEDE